MSDAARRLRVIANVSWNEMYVKVENRLPGSSADVDPDVEAIGGLLLQQNSSGFSQQLVNGSQFLVSGIKVVGKMPSGYDQNVSWGHSPLLRYRGNLSYIAMARGLRATIS